MRVRSSSRYCKDALVELVLRSSSARCNVVTAVALGARLAGQSFADDGEAKLAATVPAVSVLAHLPGRYAMPVVSRLPGLGDLPAVAMPPQKTASDPVQTVALLASANGASGRLRQRSCDGS